MCRWIISQYIAIVDICQQYKLLNQQPQQQESQNGSASEQEQALPPPLPASSSSLPTVSEQDTSNDNISSTTTSNNNNDQDNNSSSAISIKEILIASYDMNVDTFQQVSIRMISTTIILFLYTYTFKCYYYLCHYQ